MVPRPARALPLGGAKVPSVTVREISARVDAASVTISAQPAETLGRGAEADAAAAGVATHVEHVR